MGQVIQPADVRSRLREALEIDLVGPGTGHSLADERLPGWVRPSNWYLTGFLVPRDAPAEQRADADADDDFGPEVAAEGGLGDDSAALCSNDPVCAEHVPGHSMEERWLHGRRATAAR